MFLAWLVQYYLYLAFLGSATVGQNCDTSALADLAQADRILPCLIIFAQLDDFESVKLVLSLPNVMPEDVDGLKTANDSVNLEIGNFLGFKKEFLHYCSDNWTRGIYECLIHPYFKAQYLPLGIKIALSDDSPAAISALVESKHISTVGNDLLEELFLHLCRGGFRGYYWSVKRLISSTTVDPTLQDTIALKAALNSDSRIAMLLLSDPRVRMETRELYELAGESSTAELILTGNYAPTSEILSASVEAGNKDALRILVGHPDVDPNAIKQLRPDYYNPDAPRDNWMQFMAGRIQEIRSGDYSSVLSSTNKCDEVAATAYITACMNGHLEAVQKFFGLPDVFWPRWLTLQGHKLAIRFDHGDIALEVFKQFSLRWPLEYTLEQIEGSVRLAWQYQSRNSLQTFCSFISGVDDMVELIRTSLSDAYPAVKKLFDEDI